MKTSRLLAIAAAVALIVSACSGGGGSSGGKKITLMVGVKGDPFYISMECGAREAATAAGATLDVQGPDKFDATLQNPMLDAVAAAKPDALLVAPNDVKASTPPLKKIQDGGAKIVLVDTVVDDTSIGVSRVATDNNLGGQKAAEALATLGLKSGDKVLVISTDPGISSVDARVAGFGTKAAELGLVLVSDTQYSHNQAATAAQVISAALAKDGAGTLSLQAANTLTGAVTVAAGTLNLRDSAALGTASGVTAGLGLDADQLGRRAVDHQVAAVAVL